jgi:hypothetical protein
MIANPSNKSGGCGCGGGGSLAAVPCGCGGADCASCQGQGIVRPRFFAGQLLTEDDLQLLTEYVGHKNRLHNRHLFGAGVVCGLDVTCHPCGDGRVIVHPGYALDCCGNDLTLACAQSLDINAMVRDLRRDQLGGFDCGDPCPEPGTDTVKTNSGSDAAGDGKNGSATPPLRYCLYVRYCEQSSDPVMPYSTGDDCGSVACEATRLREGVKFELRCRPRGDAASPLIKRLCACLGDLNRLPIVFESLRRLQTSRQTATEMLAQSQAVATEVSKAKDAAASGGEAAATILKRKEEIRALKGAEVGRAAADAASAFRDVRDWLIERLNNSPFLTDCTLRDKVFAMSLPTFGNQLGETETRSFVAATEPLIELFINFLRDCICRAFNPACMPCEETAVLLACLEVDDCKVVKICNLERTFVLSPSAVRYWLPPLQLVGNLVERLCCDPLERLLTERSDQSLEVGIGHLDMASLLKEEVMRILEDSLCLVGKDSLKGRIEKMFVARSTSPPPPSGATAPPAASQAATQEKEKADAIKETPEPVVAAAAVAETRAPKVVRATAAVAEAKAPRVARKRAATRSRKKPDQPAAAQPVTPASTSAVQPAPTAASGAVEPTPTAVAEPAAGGNETSVPKGEQK